MDVELQPKRAQSKDVIHPPGMNAALSLIGFFDINGSGDKYIPKILPVNPARAHILSVIEKCFGYKREKVAMLRDGISDDMIIRVITCV